MRNPTARVLTSVPGCLLLAVSLAVAGSGDPGRIRFETNRGQSDGHWSFVARAGESAILLGTNEVRVGDAVLAFPGADREAPWEAIEPLPGRTHCLFGADPQRWIIDVPTFAAVVRRSIYPGIDVVMRGTSRRLDVDFVVAPYADPEAIAVELDGRPLRIGGVRAFSIELPDPGPVREPPRVGSDAEGNLFLAARAGMDGATTLVTVLDPTGRHVLRTTYLDGFDPSCSLALAVAPTGELVLAGAHAGDAVLVRLDRSGRALLGRTVFGGRGKDAALGVALSNDGAWIAGRTSSTDFPVSRNTLQQAPGGGTDGFLAKIDDAGRVAFASCLGGTGEDQVQAVAVDLDGNVVLTGSTRSPDFPGAKSLGGTDAFVAKIDPESASLFFAEIFGGEADDEGNAIAIAPSGEIVVAGTTRSESFSTFGLRGRSDAFLASLDGSTGALDFSTTLGGPTDDRSWALALDRSGRAWIAGSRGAGLDADGFVSRVALDGRRPSRDEIVAGDREDLASGLTLTAGGDVAVIGLTRSSRLAGAERSESTRDGDVFVTFLPQGVCPGTKNFLGTDSNAWEDPDNWSGASLPTSTDDVCISGFNVVIGSGSQDAGTLRVENGSLTVNVATLTVAGASEIVGDLSINGGTLTGTGNVTISGTFAWTGGTLGGSGVTTANGPVSLSGADTKSVDAHTLNTHAAVTWTGAGSVSLSTGSVINNASTWDCQSDATLAHGGGAFPSFNNGGTFRKSAGAGKTTLQAPFVNSGSVIVAAGTIDVNAGSSSSTGSFSLAAGTALEVSGGALNLNAGTTFTGSGQIQVSGGTLSAGAAVAVPSTITLAMTGGAIGGTGTLTLAGTMNWFAGAMNTAGVTTCNGALNIVSSGAKSIVSRTLNVNSTTTFAGVGNLALSLGAVVNNAGTWDCQSDATINQSGPAGQSFNNSGLFQKSGGTGTSTVQLPFVNSGSSWVQTGTINVRGGGSSTGSFTVNAGATLEFGASTFTLSSPTAFFGSGTVLLNGAGLVSASVALPATLTFNMAAGNLSGTGTFTIGGTMNWTGGTMGSGLSGTTTCNGPLNLSGAGARQIFFRTLNNNATATWTGSGGLSLGGSAVINNNGTWDCQNAGTMSLAGGSPPSFRNFATFRKTAAGTTSLQIPFSNAGTVDVAAGVLDASNYTQTAGTTRLTGGAFSSSGNIAITGGTLAGSGTVNGLVLVYDTGALAPGLSAGALNLNGNYSHQPIIGLGSYNVELGGLTPGAQYDRANVTGSASLGGALNVSLINGFVPSPGDSFTIMTYASVTGTYTPSLPEPGCIGWEIGYGPTALALTARAVPAELKRLVHPSKTDLEWAPGPIHSGTTYDVLRGDLGTLPVGPGPGESCLASGISTTTTSDPATPAVGAGYWYVVREKVTGCGTGTYGFSTSGMERISTACP